MSGRKERHRMYYCSNQSCERSRKPDGIWHAEKIGRFPDVISCINCGSPAYWSQDWTRGRVPMLRKKILKRKLMTEALNRMDSEAEAFLSAELGVLDPARIYLIGRGQVRDVTERFRSAAACNS